MLEGKPYGSFKIKARGSTICTELRAGTATFMTLCYILAVNARLLSESGGPCEPLKGPTGWEDEYMGCISDFRKQLITITAAASCVACILMGVFANLPFALAPGMGLNAYFTYDVVGFHGYGSIPWKTAITAVFIEGIIFMLLGIFNLRQAFAKLIPEPVKIATTGGIGLFLAHLGLQSAEGIGVVVNDFATAVTLGGCSQSHRKYISIDCNGQFADWMAAGADTADGATPYFLTSDQYTCDGGGGKMQSMTMYLGIVVLLLTGVMLKRKWPGALIIGILLGSGVSWADGFAIEFGSGSIPFLAKFSYFDAENSLHPADWSYFSTWFKVEPIVFTGDYKTFAAFDWDALKGIFDAPFTLLIALGTFLYVDLLDTTATLFAMAKFAGMLDEKGGFPGMYPAFIVDGLATSLGALIGTSPVTTYIESAPGIEEGGRTGLTAIVVGVYFGLCVFLAPILSSVPPWATGPALILVGAMMMRGLVNIDWDDYGAAIPAFLTIAIMPLTYSIAYGIIAGWGSWMIINILGYTGKGSCGKAPVFWFPDGSNKAGEKEDLEKMFPGGDKPEVTV
jgi:AGZA family xanthine/uracil permease-like MFS transporter